MQDKYQYGEDRPGNPSVAYTEQPQLRDIRKRLPLRVLSDSDFLHWQTYGYVIVKDAVSPEQVRRTTDFLWEFQGLDQHDPATWNRDQLRDHALPALTGSGIIEAYHHKTHWDNRQTPHV